LRARRNVAAVDNATMRSRLQGAPVARLATVTPAGGPHLVPCCFALDADTIFTAVDAKPKSTRQLARLDNVRAVPAASLLVDHYEDDWSQLWWVRIDGPARILDDADAARDDALDALAAKYSQYRTTRPDGAVIAIEISTWRAWP
jgi:PPOX class probable F420-dependent enzyme